MAVPMGVGARGWCGRDQNTLDSLALEVQVVMNHAA